MDVAGDRQKVSWTRTYYVVAPAGGVFRARGVVHLLAGRCEEAAQAIIANDAEDGWGSVEALAQDLEGAIPWCPTCAMRAVEASSDAPPPP